MYKVNWNGTVCAAKCLHQLQLEDESPGEVDKLISNFEMECLAWSKLLRPSVVQFLGVNLKQKSLLWMETFQTDYHPLPHKPSDHDLPVSAPSSLSSTHLSQKVNGLNRACEGALLSDGSGSRSNASSPPLQLSPSNGSCSSPVRNVSGSGTHC